MLGRCRGFWCALGMTSLLGCSHANGGGQATPTADDGGGGAPGAQPWAANAGEVARYSDEEPFGPPATVAQDKTRVRTAPGGGETVATLSSGTEVVKLASRGSDDLICFDEPKPGGRHLMGWVPQSALDEAHPAPSPSQGPAPGPSPMADGGSPSPDPPAPTPHGGHRHRHKGHHPQ